MSVKTLGSLVIVVTVAFFNGSATAQSPNPYERADTNWITIEGIVVSARDESFVMDYGEGFITVEMDDWDWYKEGLPISDGDEVIVSGLVDADLMERRSIEARSVYYKDWNIHYYASPSDDEYDPLVPWAPPYDKGMHHEGSRLTLTGRVSSVQGREFTLNTGAGRIRIDTSSMGYNPLDKMGSQRISVGDRVSVSGRLDLDFFEGREIEADSILSLKRDAGKNKAQNKREG